MRLPPQDCSTQWEDPVEILEAIKRAKDELDLCRQTLSIVGDAPREYSTKIEQTTSDKLNKRLCRFKKEFLMM